MRRRRIRLADRPSITLGGRDQPRHVGLSGTYRKVADTMLPAAVQIADPFHVVRLANQCVDEIRRRIQQEVTGHRGRKTDPLYRIRKLLIMADDRLEDDARSRRQGLLAAGDPRGEVADGWTAKQAVHEAV